MIGRKIAASYAMAAGGLLAIACGGSTASGGGAAGSTSACGKYFDIYLTSVACAGAPLPASEATRERSRFLTACANAEALPGSGLTDAYLDTCTSALAGWTCNAPTPAACNGEISGSLAAGATCESDVQCESGSCNLSAIVTPDAGTGNTGCGVCAATIPLGGACGGDNGYACAPGASCSVGSATPTCVATTSAGAGATCGSNDAICETGLVCTSMSKCAAPAVAGSACEYSSECAAGLGCENEKCGAPLAAGAACTQADSCAPGYACSPSTMTCAAVAWAAAGQTCNDFAMCMVGSCPFASDGGPATCPTILADGAACIADDSSTTCDSFASCIDGTCQIEAGSSCQ